MTALLTRHWLESSMALHMLVQLPLILIAGWSLGKAWLRTTSGSATGRMLGMAQSFNAGGLTGIVGASFVMALWMLPRFLDLARLDATTDALKFSTLFLAGLAIAVSWPRLPAIARGVVHLEVIASFFRFGWGYLATEQRLCLSYLADDQMRTGELLLWVGTLWAVLVIWRPLFGPMPTHQRSQAKD